MYSGELRVGMRLRGDQPHSWHGEVKKIVHPHEVLCKISFDVPAGGDDGWSTDSWAICRRPDGAWGSNGTDGEIFVEGKQNVFFTKWLKEATLLWKIPTIDPCATATKTAMLEKERRYADAFKYDAYGVSKAALRSGYTAYAKVNSQAEMMGYATDEEPKPKEKEKKLCSEILF